MNDTVIIAQNLARNRGFACFPVGENKHPSRPKDEGGEGYKDASKDPDRIAWLWKHWPGPLIGVATGAMSGISVLDVDQKHAPARAFWSANHHRLLPTRTFESRRGGLHLYYGHVAGVGVSAGRICHGVDTRGDGGFIIFWFGAGFGCHDHTPPQPWPEWLLAELHRPPPAPRRPLPDRPPDDEHALAGLARRVASAAEGERNAVLHWAACRCADRRMRLADAEALLIPPATQAGLSQIEIRRTINSAMRAAA